MKKLWICSLALLALSLPAAAGVGVWTPVGPDGGQVWALAVDSADPDVVYAGTLTGLFKSTDGGETWTAPSRGLGPLGVHVRVILVRPDAIYLGTEHNGVFKSTDQGATWFPASNGIPPVPSSGVGPNVSSLLRDPRNPNRIWAGALGGLFSTTNGGATWTTRYVGPPFDNPVTGIAIDPVDGRIYISSSLRGVYVSKSQGKKWTKVSRNLLGSHYYDLVLDPRTPSILHVGTASGLWRSDDRGGSWKRVPALGNRAVPALVYQGNRLLAGSTQGVFWSDDQGRTWTRARGKPADPVLVDLAAGPDKVYAGTAGDGWPHGVYRSLDRGDTWAASFRGLDSQPVWAVAVDPHDADMLYASALGQGLFKSTDRGATWELLDVGVAPPSDPRVGALLVDPSDPSTVYGALIFVGSGVLLSRDAGATWRTVSFPVKVLDLETDPRAPGAVWAAGISASFPDGGSALGHSGDYGATWTSLPFPDDVWIQAFEVDPVNPQVLWAAGGFLEETPQNNFRLHLRVYRSADGGQTWQRRDAGLPDQAGDSIEDLAIDPADPKRLYLAALTGLYRSTDAGLTWSLLPEELGRSVTEVETAPTTPTAVYAFFYGFGVQRSTDGGETWTPTRRGLAPIPLYDLTVDPTDPHRLYAGTATRSVFTYTEP